MIHPKEINKVAAENRLKDQQIEKDYVLSWLLFGVSNNNFLSANLAFKGGTALKKAYFSDYRFSEDIDFTLLNQNITDAQLLDAFGKVYAFVKERANITLAFKESNTHKSGNIAFYINYVGPLLAQLGSRDVKIDITRNEKLEFPLEHKTIFNQYSDLPEKSFSIKCYSLPEILIEKMAALMGRTEPRDFYDFWYLSEIEKMEMKHYIPEFERKAKNKNLKPENFSRTVLAKEKNLEQGWIKKLTDQLYEIPKFSDVFRESKKHFKLSRSIKKLPRGL